MSSNKKKLWTQPWSYKESFIIAFALLALGFVVEYASGGQGVSAPSWPKNLYLLLAIINLNVIAHFLYKDHPIIRWFGRVPAAISAITIFTVLILMMGFTLQEDQTASELVRRLGLSHVTRSWPYLMVVLYFLLTLGFVTLRKVLPWKNKNFGFLLNHFGLWIIIVAGILGSGDLMRFRMTLNEGRTSDTVRDYKGQEYEMPFAVHLRDFKIEEYPPKVGIVDKNAGGLAGEHHETFFEVSEGLQGGIDDLKFELIRFWPESMPQGDEFVEFVGEGSVASAEVRLIDKSGNTIRTGWLCSGNAFHEAVYFDLSKDYMLYMLQPVAKEYSSDLRIITSDFEEDFNLIVNKPIRRLGYTIYQVGYDERFGRHSTVSILEIVRDPWLPFVYIGLFMVIAGSLYIFWIGRKEKINTEKE